MDDIAGVVIAGGAGQRIGAEKALIPFGTATLIEVVITRVTPQVRTLALNVPGDRCDHYAARFGLSVLSDTDGGGNGPLGGIVAGLTWAGQLSGIRWLATFPCDTPFLPNDLVARLAAARDPVDPRPVVVRDLENVHALCALWPCSALASLRAGIADGAYRSVRRALDIHRAHHLVISDAGNAFYNVNTQADLAVARHLASMESSAGDAPTGSESAAPIRADRP